ncbi:hypothetical protein H0H87_000364 [Tephrocybe sp. NHM501043]|nr:hypothetical protein H0H87_000364 [Tephrocybe sp. NHM501043]
MASYMMQRNQRAREEPPFAREPFLPPTIDNERVWKRCYALDICMLYRKGVENADDASSPIADIYDFKLRPSLHQA